jgi:hypothetical protein
VWHRDCGDEHEPAETWLVMSTLVLQLRLQLQLLLAMKSTANVGPPAASPARGLARLEGESETYSTCATDSGIVAAGWVLFLPAAWLGPISKPSSTPVDLDGLNSRLEQIRRCGSPNHEFV